MDPPPDDPRFAAFRQAEQERDPDYPEFVEWALLGATILSWLEWRLADEFYRVGMWFLRWGMAIIFIWFGILKLFVPPPVTAAFTEAVWLAPEGFPALLGLWEAVIGICFLRKAWMRLGILQLKIHMPGTFLPLLVTPEAAFAVYPIFPALPGLYILKNFIFFGAGLLLWYDVIRDPLGVHE